MLAVRWLILLTVAFSTGLAQEAGQRPFTTVPEQVAALVRPILDLRQQSTTECGEPGESTRKACLYGTGYEHERERWRNVAEGIANLTSRKTTATDEALVVLMCYYVGESGEHIDEVINRGRQMLPYLRKYEVGTPVIPGRRYPESLLTSPGVKKDQFTGAIDAIKHGRKVD
jgi:hypothetical protein